MRTSRDRVRQPPAGIVQWYFAAAHIALLSGFGLLAWQPNLATDFYYQPKTIAIVHLVTLGWITGSILGSFYVLAPLAWRIELPAERRDWVAFWIWAVSVSGMATHFWINEYSGMTWAGGTTLVAVAMVATKLLPRLVGARIPLEHRVPVLLAFANLGAAGGLGVLLGVQKLGLVALPGTPIDGVYAHAHVAALGWVLMMVFAAGYRLLPMFLPAPMPLGHWAWLPPILLQVAVVLLGLGLLLSNSAAIVVGATGAGLAVMAFGSLVARMFMARKPRPSSMRGTDLALPSTAAALVCLLVATSAGVGLLSVGSPESRLRLATVYGVVGLVGALAQLVVGIGGRLLPLTLWTQQFVASGYKAPAVGLHDLGVKPLQVTTFFGWATGVSVLAGAVWIADPRAARAGAALLLLGATADAANRVVMLRRSRRRGPFTAR